MGKTKQISFTKVVWEILIKPAGYYIFSIVPWGLQYLQAIRAEVPEPYRDRFMISNIYNLLPGWAWFMLGLVVFVLTVTINAYRYIRKSIEAQPFTSINSKAKSGGMSQIFKSLKNSPVNQSFTLPDKKEPPKVAVGFYDENTTLSQKLLFYLKPIEMPDIENLVEQRRKELLNGIETFDAKSKQIVLDTGATLAFNRYMQSSISGYPNKVENYLEKYRIYQNDIYVKSILYERYKKIRMVLEVQGESPASSLTIKLLFPDDFPFPPKYVEKMSDDIVAYRTLNLDYEIESPEVPDIYLRPRTSKVHGYESSDYYSSRSERITFSDLELIKEHGKNVVVYNFGDVLQNLPIKKFPPILAWFGNIHQTTSWKLDYEVYFKELPQPTKGMIEIVTIIEG